MAKKHIFLVGERGVGKSTLIRRLLEHTKRPVCGFITKSLEADADGFHPIYIHPADQAVDERAYTPDNLIGTCDTKIHNINISAFDTFGVEYLSNLLPDGIVLMDELGFMEAKSEAFTAKVLEVLGGDLPVLAAVKARTDIPFLVTVRAHPDAELFYVTPENRDELFETILPMMQTL